MIARILFDGIFSGSRLLCNRDGLLGHLVFKFYFSLSSCFFSMFLNCDQQKYKESHFLQCLDPEHFER